MAEEAPLVPQSPSSEPAVAGRQLQAGEELQVGDFVRHLMPERDSHKHRCPSDIGEIHEPGRNPESGKYFVRYLGHPPTDIVELFPIELQALQSMDKPTLRRIRDNQRKKHQRVQKWRAEAHAAEDMRGFRAQQVAQMLAAMGVVGEQHQAEGNGNRETVEQNVFTKPSVPMEWLPPQPQPMSTQQPQQMLQPPHAMATGTGAGKESLSTDEESLDTCLDQFADDWAAMSVSDRSESSAEAGGSGRSAGAKRPTKKRRDAAEEDQGLGIGGYSSLGADSEETLMGPGEHDAATGGPTLNHSRNVATMLPRVHEVCTVQTYPEPVDRTTWS
mmetsp:Transcript_67554/g.186594  ORF Transcript_67554/g.186594 Transcript_67554/m.186594 type:complete len:330 (-) Transcript_67554:2939-3928(-)